MIWQVRCVAVWRSEARSVQLRCGMTRFGRSGALRQGELCRGPVDSVGVWQVRCGRLCNVQMGSGEVR